MSWRLFRKARARALERALDSGRIDAPMAGLMKRIGRSESLAPLSSCAGRIYLAKMGMGSLQPRSYYRIWHKASREDIELALSRYGSRQLLWFVVEPFSFHVAARDARSAFAFVGKMEKEGLTCFVRKRKDHIEIAAKGPGGMSFPVNYFEGGWDPIVDIAQRILDAGLKLLKKLERRRW